MLFSIYLCETDISIFCLSLLLNTWKVFVKIHFIFFRATLGSQQNGVESIRVPIYPLPQHMRSLLHRQCCPLEYICSMDESVLTSLSHKFIIYIGFTLDVHSMAFDKCIVKFIYHYSIIHKIIHHFIALKILFACLFDPPSTLAIIDLFLLTW